MPNVVKVLDPTVTRRQLSVVIAEDTVPGLLEFLVSLPYRSEANLVRTVFYEWFLSQREAGTLDESVATILGLDTTRHVRRPAGRSARRPQKTTVQKTIGRSSAAPAMGRPAMPSQISHHGSESLTSASNSSPLHASPGHTAHVPSGLPSASASNPSLVDSSPSAAVAVSEEKDDAMESLNFLDTLP